MSDNDKNMIIREKGAVVVEATISLTLFMFMIVAIQRHSKKNFG